MYTQHCQRPYRFFCDTIIYLYDIQGYDSRLANLYHNKPLSVLFKNWNKSLRFFIFVGFTIALLHSMNKWKNLKTRHS